MLILTYTYKLQTFERPHDLKDPPISSSLVVYPPLVMNMCGVLKMCPVSVKPGSESIEAGGGDHGRWQSIPIIDYAHTDGIPSNS